MGNKAIGFIDGNNFYHRAKYNQIQPKKIDFAKIMKHICEKEKWDYSGFYYYNSIPSLDNDKRAYYNQLAYFDVVRKMEKNIEVIPRKLRYSSAKEIIRKHNYHKDILQELVICDKCIKKVESCCFNCVMEKSKREKGVDVKIAIDIIQKGLTGEYDVCILFSGDSDLLPALQLIEKHKKKVFSSFIWCRGYSWELRQNIKYLAIPKENFDNFLINP